jgi:hypothetical protein
MCMLPHTGRMFGHTCLTLLAYSGLFSSAWENASFDAHRTVPSIMLDDAVESFGISSNILSCMLQ